MNRKTGMMIVRILVTMVIVTLSFVTGAHIRETWKVCLMGAITAVIAVPLWLNRLGGDD